MDPRITGITAWIPGHELRLHKLYVVILTNANSLGPFPYNAAVLLGLWLEMANNILNEISRLIVVSSNRIVYITSKQNNKNATKIIVLTRVLRITRISLSVVFFMDYTEIEWNGSSLWII